MSGSRCGSTTQLGSLDLNKTDQVDVFRWIVAAKCNTSIYIILFTGPPGVSEAEKTENN